MGQISGLQWGTVRMVRISVWAPGTRVRAYGESGARFLPSGSAIGGRPAWSVGSLPWALCWDASRRLWQCSGLRLAWPLGLVVHLWSQQSSLAGSPSGCHSSLCAGVGAPASLSLSLEGELGKAGHAPAIRLVYEGGQAARCGLTSSHQAQEVSTQA